MRGIILTLDWTFSHRRDRGSPAIPQEYDVKTLLQFVPEALTRPRWLRDFIRAGGPPALTAPNMATPGAPAPGFFAAQVAHVVPRLLAEATSVGTR